VQHFDNRLDVCLHFAVLVKSRHATANPIENHSCAPQLIDAAQVRRLAQRNQVDRRHLFYEYDDVARLTSCRRPIDTLSWL
jgi:hypothetical protein